jgi:hypothetical protein
MMETDKPTSTYQVDSFIYQLVHIISTCQARRKEAKEWCMLLGTIVLKIGYSQKPILE